MPVSPSEADQPRHQVREKIQIAEREGIGYAYLIGGMDGVARYLEQSKPKPSENTTNTTESQGS